MLDCLVMLDQINCRRWHGEIETAAGGQRVLARHRG